MEEWVGQRWHRFITRAADTNFPHAAVPLEQVTRAVELLFRAGGGDALVRVVPASAGRVGGPRSWLQRIAGQGERVAQSTLDAETLALPPVLAVFDEASLNRELYLWLAALSACHVPEPAGDWVGANLRATVRALQRFPGLRGRYRRLVRAELAQRPTPERLKPPAAAAETAVRQALIDTLAPGFCLGGAASERPGVGHDAVAPVWLWLQQLPPQADGAGAAATPATGEPNATPRPPDARTQQDSKRRRAQRSEDTSNKDGLVMFFRAESILSWSEFVRVNRTGDDEDNQDASEVADDMEQLTVARDGQTLAARVKFDLDLPSASADDLPVGEGEPLPEWDFKRQQLVPDRCRAQRLRARAPADDAALLEAQARLSTLAKELRPLSRQVRRRFEALRAAPRWRHGLAQGDALDLDAWVRFQVDRVGAHQRVGEAPPVFSDRVRTERSLAALLLADLSLSTDAYATPQARVIDLVRDSLLVFGDALQGVGDPFEMLGFSSVRRAVRIHELKRFGETWNDPARLRVAAIKPGFYTRMGAAIRHGTRRLAERGERQRLLLLLSDGKPNDLDHYEGRAGLEDTRHAVLEARQAGLTPFCVTIDQQAQAYLPRLFGAQGYALVHRPEQLARALTQVYVGLTAGVR
ncbi:MAG: VWA domain-containing protein [Proteobacteria bacterium]|nr:VWA domain-containing protein [Pseudomonadota bacterium]